MIGAVEQEVLQPPLYRDKANEEENPLGVDLHCREDLLLANVYNSGEPVPEEYRPFLFERLKPFRAAGMKSQGLGLGLHLVKQAVTKHGGEIRYEVKGNGSSFLFTLPRNSTGE